MSKINEILEAVKGLTVLELSELVKALKKNSALALLLRLLPLLLLRLPPPLLLRKKKLSLMLFCCLRELQKLT